MEKSYSEFSSWTNPQSESSWLLRSSSKSCKFNAIDEAFWILEPTSCRWGYCENFGGPEGPDSETGDFQKLVHSTHLPANPKSPGRSKKYLADPTKTEDQFFAAQKFWCEYPSPKTMSLLGFHTLGSSSTAIRTKGIWAEAAREQKRDCKGSVHSWSTKYVGLGIPICKLIIS